MQEKGLDQSTNKITAMLEKQTWTKKLHYHERCLLGQEGSGRDARQDDLTKDTGRHRLKIHGEQVDTIRGGADNHTNEEKPGQEIKFLKRERTVTTK